MKYTFDYSCEFNESLKCFDTGGHERLMKHPLDFIDTKFQISVLDNEKLELFNDMFKLLNCAAKISGATIEMSIDEKELVGQIVLKCTEYYIILDGDDATRRALVFALEKADTAVIRNVGNKVVIDMNVSLKKYLTNRGEGVIM